MIATGVRLMPHAVGRPRLTWLDGTSVDGTGSLPPALATMQTHVSEWLRVPSRQNCATNGWVPMGLVMIGDEMVAWSTGTAARANTPSPQSVDDSQRVWLQHGCD